MANIYVYFIGQKSLQNKGNKLLLFYMENSSNQKQKIYSPGDNYEIPVEGSLGLLALGHVGLKLWREKRKEHQAKTKADRTKIKSNNESKDNG